MRNGRRNWRDRDGERGTTGDDGGRRMGNGDRARVVSQHRGLGVRARVEHGTAAGLYSAYRPKTVQDKSRRDETSQHSGRQAWLAAASDRAWEPGTGDPAASGAKAQALSLLDEWLRPWRGSFQGRTSLVNDRGGNGGPLRKEVWRPWGGSFGSIEAPPSSSAHHLRPLLVGWSA